MLCGPKHAGCSCWGAHSGLLARGVEAEVEVPDEPVAHGGPQLEGGAQHAADDALLQGAPLVDDLLLYGVPGCVLHQPAALPWREDVQQVDAPALQGFWDVSDLEAFSLCHKLAQELLVGLLAGVQPLPMVGAG